MQIIREFKVRDTSSFENHFFLKNKNAQFTIALYVNEKNDRAFDVQINHRGVITKQTWILKSGQFSWKSFFLFTKKAKEAFFKDQVRKTKWVNLK